MEFSLIVPTYNEEGRMETPVQGVAEYLRRRFSKWEAIYVDDGSKDSTYDKLLQLRAMHSEFRVLHYEKNRGKGFAVRKGLEAARGNLILFSDADFSTPIQELETLMKQMSNGFDIVIGSRGLPDSKVDVHQPWFRETIGKSGNLLVRASLPIDFTDTQCGFKLFTKKAAQFLLPRLTIEGFAFDIEILAVAQFHGLRIAEVPVVWRDIPKSKVRLRHSFEVLRDLFTIRYRLAMGRYA
ncbi:MAG TPA: dolichyl-phosphate beta-glucosyltransferase [Acidobacteriota bacterium]|nr:dolichyl-phosphate beta-glucosyltransferase [Acidobacteriota bacterium]